MGLQKPLYHFLAWVGLYMLNALYSLGYYSAYGFWLPINYLAYFIIVVAAFYFHYLWLIPELLEKGKKTLYYASLMALVLPFHFLNQAVDSLTQLWVLDRQSPVNNWKVFRSMADYVIYMFAGFGLRRINQSLALEKEKQELEKLNLRTQVSYLKEQINPHFLFNALNTIYALSLKQAKETPEVIVKLSDILRYLIYSSRSELVSLSREMETIKSYLELQRKRLGESFQIEVKEYGSSNGVFIIPMVLIVLVENAFKHGELQKSGFVSIVVEIEQDSLLFSVQNKIKPKEQVEPGGIGLKNIRQRMDLTYKDHYRLRTEQIEDTFIATLRINRIK